MRTGIGRWALGLAAIAATISSSFAEVTEEAAPELEFAAARAAGQAMATSEGYAAACQAGLVLAAYVERGTAAVASLHRAMADCVLSIEMGASSVDPYLTYAVAVGFEARRLGSRSLGVASRRLMEETVKRYPSSGFARAALAGWHSSVSKEGFLVRTVLGASRDRAREGFVAAMRLEPDSYFVNYERLCFLAGGDATERRQAAGAAAELGALAPADAYEEILMAQAAVIAGALESDAKATAALAQTQPFADVEGLRRMEGPKPRFLDGFPPPTN